MASCIPALSCAAFLAFAPLSAAAQQFSAAIEGNPANVARGRVIVADGKVHLELPDFPDGHFLIDPACSVAYFIRPKQRVFMEARQSSGLAQILVSVDPDAPCRQWQEIAAITQLPGTWQCALFGREQVGEHEAVRYRTVAPDAHAYDIWIDPTLRFAVKVQAEVHAIVTLIDIEEGPQPKAAFEIPAGFSKFDPQGLIDRIKQSDVWVESPEAR